MPKFQSGEIKGKLEIVEHEKDKSVNYYKCKCECGKNVRLTEYMLEKYDDCGCNTKIRYHSAIGQIKIGDKIGHLEILEKVPSEKYRTNKYLARCECGDESWYTHGTLANKNKKGKLDCGCVTGNRLKDLKTVLTGKRSGKLLAIKWLRSENYRNIWLCKCDCGRYTEIMASNFNFRTESCGKCTGEYSTKYMNNRQNEIPNYLWKNILEGAQLRDFEFNITPDFLWDLFLKQNGKCKLTGRAIQFNTKSTKNTASLDRVDSKVGYIESNVQWVHKDVNIIKNRFDEDYFVKICEDVYTNRKDCIKEIIRPSWVDYFFSIASMVSTRSVDAETKVGSVITNSDNEIIATGYNSFPRGIPDDKFPNTRPEKYLFVVHSEICCLSNCPSLQLADSIYITRKPCLDCFKMILASPIKNIYVMDIAEDKKENDDAIELLLHHSKVNYYLVKPKLNFMRDISMNLYTGSELQDNTNINSIVQITSI
jgi:dCMP deaminase